MPMETNTDAIVIGAGLAGLIAAVEIAAAGKRVFLLDQEGEQNIGGQAFWSLGGLFLVNSPEQRRLGIHDSIELAWQDWLGTAAFDRPEDYWPKKWAEAYVSFAAGEKRSWLLQQGIRFFPLVGWAERGGYSAAGHGNAVPRFHIAWGTGTGVVAPFIQKVYEAVNKGLIILKFRHKVTALETCNHAIQGVHGHILAADHSARGQKSSREVIGDFSYQASCLIVASGGIGGNLEMIRKNWPARLNPPPSHMLCGVPDYVDGSMLNITKSIGASIINADRMWHYTEGVQNWNPIWSNHGIRILPGPSSLWFDALGKRFPVPLFPGSDTLGSLDHIMQTNEDHSWFILNQRIIKKEFALSGSEQNPDLTNKKWSQILKRATGKKATPPVEAFKEKGKDFIVENNLKALIEGMNRLTEKPSLDYEKVLAEIKARDNELKNPFGKDLQTTAIRGARKYIGDRLIRTARLHPILEKSAGPLIAVKLHLLTRKTLGGLETNLSAQVLDVQGNIIEGLYAAGEAAGFGGGGMHGYRSLEGSFLGGCIFCGIVAGRSTAKAL